MRFLGLLVAISLALGMPAHAQRMRTDNVPLKIRLEFHIKPAEMPALRGVLTRFAQAEQLALQDIGPNLPEKDGRPLFVLQLDQGDSLRVIVMNIDQEERMLVWFYELKPGSRLAEIDAKLEPLLRQRWPTLAPSQGP